MSSTSVHHQKERPVKSLINCQQEPKLMHLFMRHWILQSPLYYIRAGVGAIYAFIIVPWLRKPVERDIIDFIESTTLGILVKQDEQGTCN